jgi:hypothetical protein
VALFKHAKNENKKYGDKTTFYIFKALNAHVSRQNFYIKLNQCPSLAFSE